MFFIYFNIIDTELKSQSADHEGDKIGMTEMEDDSDKQKPGFISEKPKDCKLWHQTV